MEEIPSEAEAEAEPETESGCISEVGTESSVVGEKETEEDSPFPTPSSNPATGWLLVDVGLAVVVRSTLVVVGLLWWASRFVSCLGEALAWVVELIMLVLLPR